MPDTPTPETEPEHDLMAVLLAAAQAYTLATAEVRSLSDHVMREERYLAESRHRLAEAHDRASAALAALLQAAAAVRGTEERTL